MRERPGFDEEGTREIRITPACAGKTPAPKQLVRRARDHPRMCGKDPVPIQRYSLRVGSPPHVRERRSVLLNLTDLGRITPACAGKTIISLRQRAV